MALQAAESSIARHCQQHSVYKALEASLWRWLLEPWKTGVDECWFKIALAMLWVAGSDTSRCYNEGKPSQNGKEECQC